jgi:hypothetical protein
MRKRNGKWVVPVEIEVDASLSEVQAKSNVTSLLSAGLPFCANPGTIESFHIGARNTAK